MPALQAGTYDYVAAPTTVTKERADNMLFTEGYLKTDFQFGSRRARRRSRSSEDLKGKAVSVNKGTPYETHGHATRGQRSAGRSRAFDTQTDAAQAVLAGRAYANARRQHRDRLGGEEQPQLDCPTCTRPASSGRRRCARTRPSCATSWRTRSSA